MASKSKKAKVLYVSESTSVRRSTQTNTPLKWKKDDLPLRFNRMRVDAVDSTRTETWRLAGDESIVKKPQLEETTQS